MIKKMKKIITVSFIIFVGTSCLLSYCSKKSDKKELMKVPDWAKNAMWYQIFPERLRNGDPHNNQKFEDIIC